MGWFLEQNLLLWLYNDVDLFVPLVAKKPPFCRDNSLLRATSSYALTCYLCFFCVINVSRFMFVRHIQYWDTSLVYPDVTNSRRFKTYQKTALRNITPTLLFQVTERKRVERSKTKEAGARFLMEKFSRVSCACVTKYLSFFHYKNCTNTSKILKNKSAFSRLDASFAKK